MMQHTKRLKSEQRGEDIYCVRATDVTGRKAYYFIRLDPYKKQAFLRLPADAAYTITDYGNVLASGYGAPPPELVARMNAEYGTAF